AAAGAQAAAGQDGSLHQQPEAVGVAAGRRQRAAGRRAAGLSGGCGVGGWRRAVMSRIAGPITMAELRLHVPDAAHPRRVGWLSQVGDNIRVSFDDAYVGDAARPTLSQLYRGAGEA